MRGFHSLSIAISLGVLTAPSRAAIIVLGPPDLNDVGRPTNEIGIGPDKAIVKTYEDGDTADLFLAINTSGKRFTDFHVRVSVLQERIEIVSSPKQYFETDRCKVCAEQFVVARGESLGWKPGEVIRLSTADFARTLSGKPYTVKFWGSVDPIPEPASWMMMIGGVGLVGWLVRRDGHRIRMA